MKPTQELERLFGPDWPAFIDELNERTKVRMSFTEEVEVVGFSYRHDTLCLYVGVNGERKTIPLSDIDAIDFEHALWADAILAARSHARLRPATERQCDRPVY